MTNVKKYQDVDLYALLGVEPEATEKEVKCDFKRFSESQLKTIVHS